MHEFINRNLQIIEKDGLIYAQFNRVQYYTGRIYRVNYLLMPQEADKARELLKAGNPYDIDNFCYSIG